MEIIPPRKLEKIAKIVDEGDFAILEHLLEVEERFDSVVDEIKKSQPDLTEILGSIKGKDGDQGKTGPQGPVGETGPQGPKGENGKDGINGRDGLPGRDGRDGLNGVDGLDGKDAEIDLEEVTINTVNYIETLQGDDRISKDAIKGLEGLPNPQEMADLKRVAYQKAENLGLPVTTTHFYQAGAFKGRAKNINYRSGATVTVQGDTAIIDGTGGSGGGVTSISKSGSAQLTGDVTFTATGDITLTQSGNNLAFGANFAQITQFEEMVATGTRNTSNKDFTFTAKPIVIIANGFTLHYSATANAYSFTWNAGSLTATIPQPVGTSGVIFGLGAEGIAP